MGVPDERTGMFGGGGVPVYCARRNRGLGEPEMLMPGLPLVNSLVTALSLGLLLEMSSGRVGAGVGVRVSNGDDMDGDDGGCGG